MTGFADNIEKLTKENDNFRKVLFTGEHMQLVLMTLLPGEDIGLEVHNNVDQFFRVDAGHGKVVMNGQEQDIEDGFAVLVPAGTEHNIVNTGDEPLRLYTIYAPPNHPDGTVHATKAEADEYEATHHHEE